MPKGKLKFIEMRKLVANAQKKYGPLKIKEINNLLLDLEVGLKNLWDPVDETKVYTSYEKKRKSMETLVIKALRKIKEKTQSAFPEQPKPITSNKPPEKKSAQPKETPKPNTTSTQSQSSKEEIPQTETDPNLLAQLKNMKALETPITPKITASRKKYINDPKLTDEENEAAEMAFDAAWLEEELGVNVSKENVSDKNYEDEFEDLGLEDEVGDKEIFYDEEGIKNLQNAFKNFDIDNLIPEQEALTPEQEAEVNEEFVELEKEQEQLAKKQAEEKAKEAEAEAKRKELLSKTLKVEDQKIALDLNFLQGNDFFSKAQSQEEKLDWEAAKKSYLDAKAKAEAYSEEEFKNISKAYYQTINEPDLETKIKQDYSEKVTQRLEKINNKLKLMEEKIKDAKALQQEQKRKEDLRQKTIKNVEERKVAEQKRTEEARKRAEEEARKIAEAQKAEEVRKAAEAQKAEEKKDFVPDGKQEVDDETLKQNETINKLLAEGNELFQQGKDASQQKSPVIAVEYFLQARQTYVEAFNLSGKTEIKTLMADAEKHRIEERNLIPPGQIKLMEEAESLFKEGEQIGNHGFELEGQDRKKALIQAKQFFQQAKEKYEESNKISPIKNDLITKTQKIVEKLRKEISSIGGPDDTLLEDFVAQAQKKLKQADEMLTAANKAVKEAEEKAKGLSIIDNNKDSLDQFYKDAEDLRKHILQLDNQSKEFAKNLTLEKIRGSTKEARENAIQEINNLANQATEINAQCKNFISRIEANKKSNLAKDQKMKKIPIKLWEKNKNYPDVPYLKPNEQKRFKSNGIKRYLSAIGGIYAACIEGNIHASHNPYQRIKDHRDTSKIYWQEINAYKDHLEVKLAKKGIDINGIINDLKDDYSVINANTTKEKLAFAEKELENTKSLTKSKLSKDEKNDLIMIAIATVDLYRLLTDENLLSYTNLNRSSDKKRFLDSIRIDADPKKWDDKINEELNKLLGPKQPGEERSGENPYSARIAAEATSNKTPLIVHKTYKNGVGKNPTVHATVFKSGEKPSAEFYTTQGDPMNAQRRRVGFGFAQWIPDDRILAWAIYQVKEFKREFPTATSFEVVGNFDKKFGKLGEDYKRALLIYGGYLEKYENTSKEALTISEPGTLYDKETGKPTTERFRPSNDQIDALRKRILANPKDPFEPDQPIFDPETVKIAIELEKNKARELEPISSRSLGYYKSS